MGVLDRTALEDNELALEHAAQCWSESRTDEESTCCMRLIDLLLDERRLLQQIARPRQRVDVVRLRLALFGRDVLELTATRHSGPEPDDPPEPFGFFGGSSLWTERAEAFDETDGLTE